MSCVCGHFNSGCYECVGIYLYSDYNVYYPLWCVVLVDDYVGNDTSSQTRTERIQSTFFPSLMREFGTVSFVRTQFSTALCKKKSKEKKEMDPEPVGCFYRSHQGYCKSVVFLSFLYKISDSHAIKVTNLENQKLFFNLFSLILFYTKEWKADVYKYEFICVHKSLTKTNTTNKRYIYILISVIHVLECS